MDLDLGTRAEGCSVPEGLQALGSPPGSPGLSWPRLSTGPGEPCSPLGPVPASMKWPATPGLLRPTSRRCPVYKGPGQDGTEEPQQGSVGGRWTEEEGEAGAVCKLGPMVLGPLFRPRLA